MNWMETPDLMSEREKKKRRDVVMCSIQSFQQGKLPTQFSFEAIKAI